MKITRNEKYNEKLIDGELYAEMIKGGAACLRANADEVNELNVFPVPDGDTGDNMSMTAEGGAAALEGVSGGVGEISATAARGMLLGARGNSGVILSQMFAGIAKTLEGKDASDLLSFCDALRAGVKKAYSAVMNPAEGTILTVMREGVEAAVAAVNADSTVGSLVFDIVSEMKKSLERTPDLLPILKDAGVVDSGGAGLFYIFEGFLKVLRGEEIASGTSSVKVQAGPDLDAFGPDDEMTYGYCTELMLRLQNSKVDAENFDEKTITDYLNTVGNSIVAFKTGTIVKIHVHTLTPEKVLGFCRQFGEFLTVKIENMSVQHNETVAEDEGKKSERERFGFVAVASGDGMAQIFRDLGVGFVIDGGQTNNPSTADFIDAFDRVNAETVFVLPNNGNIILAADQAAELYEKSKIIVIPSRDVGAGYAALTSLDLSSDDADATAASMVSAMGEVTTGYVSSSIRDASLNGVEIKSGDYIGFVGKTMLVSTRDMSETAASLADRMLDGDRFMMTVFCGKDATDEAKAALEAHVAKKFPDVEVYLVDGGQDVYPFIYVVE